MKRALAAIGAVCVSTLTASPVLADEGMWLLNEAPRDMIAERYDVVVTDDWLEHLQKSAVNFGGASASWVSPDGLVLTNHHVARSQLAKLSTPERNLLEDGFVARSRAEELRCPDIVLKQLVEIEDVTDRVERAVSGKRGEAAERARKAEIAAIETESEDATGLYSQVVELFGGGKHHLYRFERFTDVRIVFAPEGAIAHFGGDVDNFEFPRFCLDMALVRVYGADGQPHRPEHYLRVDTDGVTDGDPVFVVGHPGRTQRLYTTDHLRHLRDVVYPRQMHRARTREVELLVLSSQGDELKALAERDLKGYQNWRKGSGGKLRALQDPRIFQIKVDEETELRRAIDASPELKRLVGPAFQEIERAMRVAESIDRERSVLEGSFRRPFTGSDLFRFARILVRMGDEITRPEGERLAEFRTSNLPNVELALFSEAPVHEALEVSRIESHLAWAAEVLGAEHPAVVTMLAGQGPADRARELVAGTRLADIDFREELAGASGEALTSTGDPMIELAMAIDPIARRVRERHETMVEAVERDAYGRLAAARFAIMGDAVYPDATGTLRLATGVVEGLAQDGEPVAPFTAFGGLYERYDDRGPHEPFDLPQSWIDARGKLDASTPFNLVSTNDIIGGNSGSPLVDADGELVGLVFDGNRFSFVWDTVFTREQGRSVSVDVRSMIEALRTVYGADDLADEMLGR
jgi:hypothetical protein